MGMACTDCVCRTYPGVVRVGYVVLDDRELAIHHVDGVRRIEQGSQ
jgi:hypothetical protein